MNASDDQPRSTRVEREILEILERADAKQTPVENLQVAMRRRAAGARSQMTRAAWRQPRSLRQLPSPIIRLAAALVLAVCAVLVGGASHLLAVILAIASGLAFFSLWVPAGPSGPGDAPRWRGRDLRDDGPRSFFDDRPGRGPRLPRR